MIYSTLPHFTDHFLADIKFTVLILQSRFYCHLNIHGTMHSFYAQEVTDGVICIGNFRQGQLTPLSPGNGAAVPLTHLTNVAINQNTHMF